MIMPAIIVLQAQELKDGLIEKPSEECLNEVSRFMTRNQFLSSGCRLKDGSGRQGAVFE